jgi:small multidrug resistance family-3 protein
VVVAVVPAGLASLVWAEGVVLVGFRPDGWDTTGALICLVGVAVTMYAPRPA